jgi:bacterial/archaeal transporter family-2 protein
MTATMIVIVLGLVGGFAAGLQGPLASLMARDVGTWGSVFLIHLGGLVGSALILLWPGASRLSAWRDVPWYALIAGLLGLVLLGALTFCIPRLGIAATMTLIIVGQLTVAAILDHYGIFVESIRSFDLSRLAGMVVLLIGTWLMVR